MQSVRRWDRSDWTGRLVIVFAITASLLLVNSISLVPAMHHHGETHDSHDCSICTFITKATWAPAVSPPMPDLPRVAVLAFAPEICPHAPTAHPLPPVRGPPAGA